MGKKLEYSLEHQSKYWWWVGYKYGSQERSTHTVTDSPLLNRSNIFHSSSRSSKFAFNNFISLFSVSFSLEITRCQLFAAMRRHFCNWVKRSLDISLKLYSVSKLSRFKTACSIIDSPFQTVLWEKALGRRRQISLNPWSKVFPETAWLWFMKHSRAKILVEIRWFGFCWREVWEFQSLLLPNRVLGFSGIQKHLWGFSMSVSSW